MVDSSILHQPRQNNTGGIMVKLFNLNEIHLKMASDIDAITLLHFICDSVKDWECAEPGICKNDKCPLWYDITKITENGNIEVKMCILDAIKDLGYIHLEKPEEEME